MMKFLVWQPITAFCNPEPGNRNVTHLVHRLELLICHKLNGIEGEVPEQEGAIASKKAPHSLSSQYVPDCNCSAPKFPCRAKGRSQWLSHAAKQRQVTSRYDVMSVPDFLLQDTL